MTNKNNTIKTVKPPKCDEAQEGETKVTMECSTIEQTEKNIEDLILKVFENDK